MIGKSSPERALAAYFRQMARQPQGTLPLQDLPSRACEATLDERDDVMVRHSSRTLAVYRIKSLSEKSLCRIPVAEGPIDIGGLKALEHQVHRTYPYHRLA